MERAKMDEDTLKQGDDRSAGEKKKLEASESSRQTVVDHVSKNFFQKVSITRNLEDDTYRIVGRCDRFKR